MPSSSRSVVLLDSNILAGLSLYLAACSQIGAAPGTSTDTLLAAFLGSSSAATRPDLFVDKGAIDQGRTQFAQLSGLSNSSSGLDLYASRVSHLEVRNLLTERAFDECMHACNVPFRMRSRRPFRCQISFDYSEKVDAPWTSLLSVMEQCGLKLQVAEDYLGEEDESRGFQIMLDATEAIARCFNLEDVDLYLCAVSLVIPVDTFFSRDNEVSHVMNSLRTNLDWRPVADRVISEMAAISETFREHVRNEEKKGHSKYSALPQGTSSLHVPVIGGRTARVASAAPPPQTQPSS